MKETAGPLLEYLCDSPDCPVARFGPDEFWATLEGFKKRCQGTTKEIFEFSVSTDVEVTTGTATTTECSEIEEADNRLISYRDILK